MYLFTKHLDVYFTGNLFQTSSVHIQASGAPRKLLYCDEYQVCVKLDLTNKFKI
jgi:hypothetical protein